MLRILMSHYKIFRYQAVMIAKFTNPNDTVKKVQVEFLKDLDLL